MRREKGYGSHSLTKKSTHSLTAGKVENAHSLCITKLKNVDIVSYCDNIVGIKTTNNIQFFQVLNL